MLKRISENREEFLWPMVLAIAISAPLVFFSGHPVAIIVSVLVFSAGSFLWWLSEAMIQGKAKQIVEQAKSANIHLGTQVRAFENIIDSDHCHNNWLVHRVAVALGIDENASIEEKWRAIRNERHGMTSLLKHIANN